MSENRGLRQYDAERLARRIGKRYGPVTILADTKKRAPRGGYNRNRVIFLVRCDCGNEFERTADQLSKNPEDRRCACHRRRWRSSRQEPLPYGAGLMPHALFDRTRRGALSRNMVFDISPQFVWGLFCRQQGRCALSGMQIHFGDPSSTWLGAHNSIKPTASLDRKDSLVGYTPDNVQWVHKAVNQMKMDLPEPFFLAVCRRISVHTSSPA
jgi:hypothetical protein